MTATTCRILLVGGPFDGERFEGLHLLYRQTGKPADQLGVERERYERPKKPTGGVWRYQHVAR